MTIEEKNAIKEANIKQIEAKNYRFTAWLPILEDPNTRSIDVVRGRISVMNALINISFEAPVEIIRNWIDHHGLTKHLSKWEQEILQKDNNALSDRELSSLRWYLEGLWALMWATELVNNLDETTWCGDHMASLLPNLERNENNEKIDRLSSLRSDNKIYTMLDFYYRLHWYCVDERLKGKQALINEGLVYERRKALEWLIDKDADWDDIEMGT